MNDYSKTGVYVIENLVNGKRYVGSAAVSFRVRWTQHHRALISGTHNNRYFQAAWIKHGREAFDFRILEITKPEHAVAVEQTFLDCWKTFDRKHGYNLSPTAGSGLGLRRTPEARAASSKRAKKQFESPEARARLSEQQRKQWASPESRVVHSQKMKIAHSKPEVRAATSARVKKLYESPEARAVQAEGVKRSWAIPEVRARRCKMMKITNGSPEVRAACSARVKALYADPVRKAAILAKRRDTLAAKKFKNLALVADQK